jgi:hypothetical protein
MALGALTKIVASNVIKPLFSKTLNTSDALAHAAVANSVNRMQGFYAGGLPKTMGIGKAAVKTLSNMLIEQANPRVLKLRRDFGIGRETQQVSIKNLEKLRTDISLSDKAKAALKAKVLKNESRKMSWIRTLEGDEKAPPQYLKRLKKVNPEDRNALLNIARAEHVELVAQREALGDLSAITTKTKARSTLGKTIMGQQTSQYLHGLMQGRPSALLENKLGKELYHTIGKFNEKEFIAIKNFESPAKESIPDAWRVHAMEKMKEAWGKDLPKGEEVIMAVRKTAPSIASGNLMNEIVRRSHNDTLFKKLFAKHKSFKGTKHNHSQKARINEMKQAMLREWPAKDGKKSTWEYGDNFIIRIPVAKTIDKSGFKKINFEVTKNGIWHGDSFKSSAYELGGVNVQTLVRPNGQSYHFVSDIQDFLSMQMPRGKALITVSTMLQKSYVGRKLSKELEDVHKAWKEKGLAGRDKLFEEHNVMESMRTGEAPAMPEAIGGMIPRQVALTEEIAALKPDNLTMKEWIEYLTKVGIVGGTGGGIGYGLFGGE